MPATKDIRVTNKSSTLIVIYNRCYARVYASGFFDLAFENVPFSRNATSIRFINPMKDKNNFISKRHAHFYYSPEYYRLIRFIPFYSHWRSSQVISRLILITLCVSIRKKEERYVLSLSSKRRCFHISLSLSLSLFLSLSLVLAESLQGRQPNWFTLTLDTEK